MMDHAHLPCDYDHDVKRFEAEVKRVCSLIRETLAYHNIGTFTFEIECRGRTSAGNARLKYSLSDTEFGSSAVTASTIRPLVEEFLRRKGFDNLHAAVELPAPGQQDTAHDLEPF